MGTKLKITFGDVKFEYKGETTFSKDDLIDIIDSLNQASVWEEGWEEFLDDEDEDEDGLPEEVMIVVDYDEEGDEGDDLEVESDDDEDEDLDEEDPELFDDVVDAFVADVEEVEEFEDEEPAEEPAVIEVGEGEPEAVPADDAYLPLQCDPAELNSACGAMVAERLGADNPASTTLAAAARLELLDGIRPFSRDQLRDALIDSGDFASDSYVHNLSRAMGDLLEDGMLIEISADSYRLSAATRRDLEARLA